MAYRVLVPIDHSEPSTQALDYTYTRHRDDNITVIHVLDPGDIVGYTGMEGGMMLDFEEIQSQRQEEGEQLLQDAQEQAEGRNIEITTEIVTGRVAQTILEYGEENDIDHIVIGSHGRTGAGRILLGSVAETVARRSIVPVTIVR